MESISVLSRFRLLYFGWVIGFVERVFYLFFVRKYGRMPNNDTDVLAPKLGNSNNTILYAVIGIGLAIAVVFYGPIIGKVYKEIIQKIYQNNELIQGKMQVGKKIVDLNNLKMPILNIVGLYDDLVPPDSSRYVMCELPSKDKSLMEYPTGHVGLCISKNAHQKLWPKVVDWLAKRS